VLEQLAAPGSRVKKNTGVAAFDSMFMLNRLDNYESARVDSELRLRALRAQLDTKRMAHEHQIRVAKAKMDQAALDLKTVPVRSAIQAALFTVAFEEARATYRSLLAQSRYLKAAQEAEIRLGQLELQEAQLEERRAKANVDKMVVRAPVSGLMVINAIFRGAEFSKIQAGDEIRPRQPYAQVVDTRSIAVKANANQVDVERLRAGAPARVHFEAYSDLVLPARVSSVAPVAQARGRRANYVSEVPVFLTLDRTDSRLIPNLTVSVDIILQRESGEEIVPREAIFRDPNDEQPFTYVETASGWEKREVKLGLASNVDVVVRSGLSSGQRVAVSDPFA
jgi:multidrug resistance efflux pump